MADEVYRLLNDLERAGVEVDTLDSSIQGVRQRAGELGDQVRALDERALLLLIEVESLIRERWELAEKIGELQNLAGRVDYATHRDSGVRFDQLVKMPGGSMPGNPHQAAIDFITRYTRLLQAGGGGPEPGGELTWFQHTRL